MRSKWAGAAMVGLMVGASPAFAQQPTMEELMRRIDALQQRVNELERERRPQRPAAVAAPAPAPAPAPAAPTRAAAPRTAPAAAPAAPVTAAAVPAPRSPETVRAEVDEALRGSLDGLAMRIPNTDTTVRLYGFLRLTAYRDFNARNPTDAASVQGIPLTARNSQSGDGDITARSSRFGFDTRSDTAWGRLDTTMEGDFRGEISAGGDLSFRLRQAFAELTRDDWSYLIGHTNSLWNEGITEALHDATNLNQSFIRQAQLRVTHRFDSNLMLQGSIEAPYGDILTQSGPAFSPIRFDGGASPAFDQIPDFLARLTWRDGAEEYVLRSLVRQLSLEPDGTKLGPKPSESTFGWGFAAHTRLPLGKWISALGRDELMLMGYYGEGIGRYFAGNTFGQGGISDIITATGMDYSLESVPSYGGTIGYRRFWSDFVRSTVSYAYARQDFPSSIRFAAGSNGALARNREMQQVIANLIWSPFADRPTSRMPFGWLDLGLEYVFSRRDLEDGAAAVGSNGVGHGIANRLLAVGIVRF
ncbi:MAG: DcaP family trimeric outer membrane transporter [Acetobacteraceae bacterium]|nr:DcaP family trimeric outer membrane transporter [Acetobacteraceae bacterium]